MRKRYRGVFIAVIVVLIAITDRLLFLPETDALAWHVGHGFSAEMNGINFSVPILYRAHLNSSPKPTLILISFNGRVRFTFTRPSRLRQATMVFMFDKLPEPPEVILDRLGGAWIQNGYQQTGERPASLAGHQGKCREYSGPPLHNDKISFGDKDIEISCYFGNAIVAAFGGTPKAVDDFYNVLHTAQSIRAKS